jgi:DNA-directed RNA polymerase subunit D
MAIEEAEIRKNSSILYDEIIAHRLGLIPLKTDLKTYNLPGKCTCEGAGCAKCTLKLTLKAKGPGMITAKDMQSSDPKVVPVYPDMPIVKLLKGQLLELEATAILGKGKDHMKWSPAIAYYKYKPVVDIAKNPDNADEVAKRCPVNVFSCKSGKLSINKDNLFDCHLCGECAEVSKGAVKLNETDSEFIFFIEPFGQLSIKEIVEQAVSVMDEKLDEFIEVIKK